MWIVPIPWVAAPPKAPAGPIKSDEEIIREGEQAIDTAMVTLMSFYMTGAVFCRSAEQSVQCFKRYSELQTQLLERQLKRILELP